jgi:hypothetical protein
MRNLNICTPHPILFGLSNRNKMNGPCSTYGEIKSVYKALVGKPEGNRPLGKPRRRWEYNIKMDLQEVGREGVWTGLF